MTSLQTPTIKIIDWTMEFPLHKSTLFMHDLFSKIDSKAGHSGSHQ